MDTPNAIVSAAEKEDESKTPDIPDLETGEVTTATKGVRLSTVRTRTVVSALTVWQFSS